MTTDAIDFDFEDVAITLNDGFPIGRFDGTASIDSDGAITGLIFSYKPAFGVEKVKRLPVPPPYARTDTWDERIATILADEVRKQMGGSIDEALREWRDDHRSGPEYVAAE